MNTLLGADEPQPWRVPVTTTAWWGFCYHCSCWFNNHQLGCPMLTSNEYPWSNAWPGTIGTTTVPVPWIANNLNSGG